MPEDLDHAAAYRGLRQRCTDIGGDLDEAASVAYVPATPAWRVTDLVAHLVGVSCDVLAGNIEGAGSDPWTEKQVEARRDRTLTENLAEWNEQAAAFDALIPLIPEFSRGQLIFDAATHEFDLRGARGDREGRDTASYEIGWLWATAMIGRLRDGDKAGALRISTEFGDQIVGTGEVTGTVRAGRFELFRAVSGRRSVNQVKAFDWDGGVHVSHLCFFRCRDSDLIE
jgi:hypothetical protein